MRYLSLFSGIEAASVAWQPLGWTCAGVAEVDRAACRVLAHHYPRIPNLGDVNNITEDRIAALGPLDLVVGGSPCQGLSSAGRRAGLEDRRSALFHQLMRIFHAAQRHCGARFLLWENVPGAFSSNAGADFAQVAGAMAGAALTVPTDGWSNEGVLLGASGLLEWSVLDARWFALAQRRRRLYALLDTGDWSRRPPVLLEPEHLRGPAAPRFEQESGAAAAAARRTPGGCGPQGQHELSGEGAAIAVHAHSIGRGDAAGPQGKFYLDDHSAFTADSRSSAQAVAYQSSAAPGGLQVRRLTPREQEALQGLPPDYTAVVLGTRRAKRVSKNYPETRWRASGEAWDLLLCDSDRYRLLGNSFAVPVLNWIGRSLQRALQVGATALPLQPLQAGPLETCGVSPASPAIPLRA
jgi:DNA (cytosine-5)-methyltransferase 1